MEPGETFSATLKFRKGDNFVVRPECLPWDGREVEVEALWPIEPDESFLYWGEWAMEVLAPPGFPRSWIASGDLDFYERGNGDVATA